MAVTYQIIRVNEMIKNQAKIQKLSKVWSGGIHNKAVSKIDTISVITNADSLDQMLRFADVMAKAHATVPAYLVGNPSDCTAITMQAMHWGMNPFSVAQKTQLINGVLGYEDELISAVIINCAPTTRRIEVEWLGDWDGILGRSRQVELNDSLSDTYIKNWSDEEEQTLSVRVWATLVDEREVRELTLRMTQVVTKNSQRWFEDPREKLEQLAIKRWARLYCPDMIMGIHTPEEIRARKVMPDDINKQAEKEERQKFAEDLLRKAQERADRKSAMISMEYDPVKITSAIQSTDTMQALNTIGKTIKSMVDDPNNMLESGSEEYRTLKERFSDQKNKIEAAQISISITTAKTINQLETIENIVEDKTKQYKPELIEVLQTELINARSRLNV